MNVDRSRLTLLFVWFKNSWAGSVKSALRGSNGSGLVGLVWVRGFDVRSTVKGSSLDLIGGVDKHSERGEERAERNVREATEAEGVDSSEVG